MKASIADHFSKAFSTYNKAALVHEKSAKRFIEILKSLDIKPKVITDIGCGTGLFTKELKNAYPQAKICAVDVSLKMLEEIKKGNFADEILALEALDYKQKVDLITLHFSLQWMTPLEETIAHCLKQAKWVAIVVPVSESFASWRKRLSLYGLPNRLFDLPDIESFRAFKDRTLFSSQRKYDMDFENPIDFARYLKSLGAGFTQAKDVSIFKKSFLKSGRLTSSYHILEIILKGDL